MATHSVTVTPASSTLLASLPDGRRMVYGKNYSISWEEWERISSSAKESLITVVSYDTTIKSRKGTDFTVNSTTVPTNYVVGGVEEGIQRFDAAMLVKTVDLNLAAGDVVYWSNYTGRVVTKDIDGTILSPQTFAGVALATVTAGRYGWIQIGGEVTAAVSSDVGIGDSLAPDPANDGVLRKAIENEIYTVTSDRTTGTWTFTYGGQTATGLTPTETASAMQTALRALSSINGANVNVTGGPLGTTPLTITFVGSLGGKNLTDATADFSGLSGGTSAALAKTQDGRTDAKTVAVAQTAYNAGTAIVNLRPNVGRPVYRRIQNRRRWW